MDTDLKNKLSAMNQLMDLLTQQLDSINFDNFDDKFQEALESMMVIQKLKKDVCAKWGKEYFEKNEPEILLKAKLIEEKYDNIIERFKNELKKVEKEISALNSQRKIVNYIR
ncbi:MAG: hypothetical protein ACOYVE_00640 [Melioribacter sp.]|jgi:CO dehydrogenase/acetyl-CoA synthase delta subunit|uniref:hypothetical protein n=1 Tax=Melioribacter sp. TaxID=2052167 RepID=UPI003BD580FE